MPLVTQLRSGDEVEIIRDQNHLPPGQLDHHRRDRQGPRRHPPRRAPGRSSSAPTRWASTSCRCCSSAKASTLDEAEGKALAERLGHASKRELLIAVGEGKIATDALGRRRWSSSRASSGARSAKLDAAGRRQGRGLVRAARHRSLPLPSSTRSRRSGPRAAMALDAAQFQHRGRGLARGRGARRPAGRHPRARRAACCIYPHPLRCADRALRRRRRLDRRALGHPAAASERNHKVAISHDGA